MKYLSMVDIGQRQKSWVKKVHSALIGERTCLEHSSQDVGQVTDVPANLVTTSSPGPFQFQNDVHIG